MKVSKVAFEAMLLRWGESSSGGATVVLLLSDPSDLEVFKHMTMAKGKRAGQRLAVAIAEIGDGEELVTQDIPDKQVKSEVVKRKGTSHFPGGLTGLAVRWCADPHFQAWIEAEIGEAVPRGQESPEDRAKLLLCRLCEVTSRKRLDELPEAADMFENLIRIPYAAQRKRDGIDD